MYVEMAVETCGLEKVMRMNKEIAKQVDCRPAWLKNDKHWDLFVDYRDSDQSAETLARMYGMSRSQAQNIINRILGKEGIKPR